MAVSLTTLPRQHPVDLPGQPSRDALLDLVPKHVLMRSHGSDLAEINRLILSIGRSDDGEATTADAAVVHSHDADAEGARHDLGKEYLLKRHVPSSIACG